MLSGRLLSYLKEKGKNGRNGHSLYHLLSFLKLSAEPVKCSLSAGVLSCVPIIAQTGIIEG